MLLTLDCLFFSLEMTAAWPNTCFHVSALHIILDIKWQKIYVKGKFEGSAVHLLKYKSWYNRYNMDNVIDCSPYLAWSSGCIWCCQSELLVCIALNFRLQSPFFIQNQLDQRITSAAWLSWGCFIFLLIYLHTHVPHSKRLLTVLLTPLSQLAFKRSLLEMIQSLRRNPMRARFMTLSLCYIHLDQLKMIRVKYELISHFYVTLIA